MRKLLQVPWEFIASVSAALAFTLIGLGALLVFGFLLAIPVALITLLCQRLF